MSEQLTGKQVQYKEAYMYMKLYYRYLTTVDTSHLPHKYGMFCPMKHLIAKDNLYAAILHGIM